LAPFLSEGVCLVHEIIVCGSRERDVARCRWRDYLEGQPALSGGLVVGISANPAILQRSWALSAA
jgi:hypothetical protein